MYKGHKFSKRLERYTVYAKAKYDELRLRGYIDLWDVLNCYPCISDAPYCVQMYIYDVIEGRGVYGECYEVVRWANGGIYVREVVGMVA